MLCRERLESLLRRERSENRILQIATWLCQALIALVLVAAFSVSYLKRPVAEASENLARETLTAAESSGESVGLSCSVGGAQSNLNGHALLARGLSQSKVKAAAPGSRPAPAGFFGK